jgi:uncharacterized membrane protein YvbJ
MYDDHDFACPHCGADLAAEEEFCRECGSDLDTGWSQFADYAGLDLPDEAEDEYEEAARDAPPTLWQKTIVATAVLLLVLFFYWIFGPWL